MMPSFYFLSADGIFITDFPLKGLNSGAKIAKKSRFLCLHPFDNFVAVFQKRGRNNNPNAQHTIPEYAHNTQVREYNRTWKGNPLTIKPVVF